MNDEEKKNFIYTVVKIKSPSKSYLFVEYETCWITPLLRLLRNGRTCNNLRRCVYVRGDSSRKRRENKKL